MCGVLYSYRRLISLQQYVSEHVRQATIGPDVLLVLTSPMRWLLRTLTE